MTVIYAYRTRRDVRRTGYHISIVCRIEDNMRASSTSFERHPDRHRAYRYAKHMAHVQARAAGVRACHYDKVGG